MHYYQRHLGDYSTATPHLSLTEHGAYTKLLDYYYSTEHPIPDDRCERIAGAFDPHERDAVRAVLQQFFTLTDAGWANDRADSEIAAYRAKSLKAKESAEARWKRTQCDGNANAYPNAMLTINQEPLPKKIKSTVQRTAARFPDFWDEYPNKKGKQEAEKRWRRDGLDAMADQIIDHVRLMAKTDDGWRRGFVPMGSTYLNQARWTDVPQAAPERVNGHHIVVPTAKQKTLAEALAPTESKLENAINHARQMYILHGDAGQLEADIAAAKERFA